MRLLDAIPEGALVALDTAIWIYEFEAHPQFGTLTNEVFRNGFGSGRNRAGCSLLILGELLVQPLTLGRDDLADQYRQILSTRPGLEVWDVTREVIEIAATLRARHRLRLIDALHIASAIVHHADLFLTNDSGLRRVDEIVVMILSDYLDTPATP